MSPENESENRRENRRENRPEDRSASRVQPPHFTGPVLFVEDVGRARAFYESALDQVVEVDFGASIGFTSGLSLWQAARASEVVFGAPGHVPAGPARGEWGELNFETIDVDATWARVRAAGGKIVHPIREQPWGQRVFRARDPDGHLFEVGEPLSVFVRRFHARGMSVAEVAARTSVPEALVAEIVEDRPEDRTET